MGHGDPWDMLDEDVIADVEGDCAVLYRLAGLEPDRAAPMRTLVVRLLGAPPRLVPMAPEATLARVAGEPRIFVRRGTQPQRARWLAGHELGEWWYQRLGYRGDDLEERCDALGAALVAPRAAFLAARHRHGDEPIALAADLCTTQSLALLRLGECVRLPVFLRRAQHTIARGAAYVLPRNPERHPGLRKVVIDDEPKRVGFIAAG